VLLVANHHGGFVDPALLVATVPRPVRFLAMASLFRVPPLRPLLALAGTIPVHRAHDAEGGAVEPRRNVDAFAACFAHLRDGGAIGIFPEGQASDEPHLLPVKTGAARIVLGAHSRGAMGLTIVPVGLIYEAKQRARSRAYVRVGDPIVMDEDLATNPAVPPDETDRDAVLALTNVIEERLADAALDFESAEQRSALRLAANVELRWVHGDPRGRPPVGEVERLADRLSEIHPVTEAAIRSAAIDYREGLAAAGVSDAVVAPGAGTAFARRSRAGRILTFALAPLAAAGLLANAVPTALVYAVGHRPMPPVTHATTKFLTAIVAFSANWAALRWWVLADTIHPWLLVLAAGPACGLAALWYVGRTIRARRARLGLRRLASAAGVLEDLRARRARLVHAVRAATATAVGSTADGAGLDDRRREGPAGSLDLHP
jgi:1-acyl-sn-glycerol-3-phosphate acyltransferase